MVDKEKKPELPAGAVEKYDLEIFDNHFIFQSGLKKVLIDTGSAVSIGESEVMLLGEKHNTIPSLMGTSIDGIIELLNAPFDILLGGDILKDLYMTINIDTRKVVFSKEKYDHQFVCLPIDFVLNVPVIEIALGSRHIKAFLDTGAKISYLTTEYL